MKQVIQDYNMLFFNIVSKYDISDSNIVRKIIHSYDVAKICYSIASNLNLDENERNFCYLIGLLHDLGRFKQWEIYKTYNDKESIDHGELSKEMLDDLNCKDVFCINEKQEYILKESIRYHTKEYEGNDEEVSKYIKIIKNADAFSNVFSTASGMQQIFVSEEGYNKDLLDDFNNKKKLNKYSYKSKLDRALMLAACLYYVEYDFLRKEIVNSNYIDIVYETFSKYLNDEEKLIYKNSLEKMKKNYL
ncbi:MAG: HD domain-containing protein [Bacilli bacterium]|nr:HD domain-containing protein [Bacilli bacterium]